MTDTWRKDALLAYARAHGERREHGGMTWFALYTNPRCENRVELRLLEEGLCTYQPEGAIWSNPRKAPTHQRRLRSAAPRYVFVADPYRAEPRFWNIRQCDGVHGWVGINNRPIAISATDISRWRRAEAQGAFDFNQEPRSAKGHDLGLFSAGEPVAIVSGPFASFSAVAQVASGRYNVGVEMMIFGRQVAVNVPLSQVHIPEHKRAA